jgi:hypothetical protein
MTTLELSACRVEPSQAAGTVGRLVGYAAVFDRQTTIDSWEGTFRETIAQGAFRTTLAQRGDRVKVLFNHGFDPSIGDKPLGKPDVMREDTTGLWVEVPLDDTSYNRDLVASLRSGALDGQSFRFSVKREEWDDEPADGGLPMRTLLELKLYEFGPVTFPAYEATTAGVRARPAYAAWRTAHSTGPAVAESGAADPTRSTVAESGADAGTTVPPATLGRPAKELAQAIRTAKEFARP